MTRPVGYQRVFTWMMGKYNDENLATQMTIMAFRDLNDVAWVDVAESLILNGGFTQIEVDELKELIFIGAN